MKLLIITQKVDINDDVLGFFHRWIEEFAKYCEKVTVICLQKGEYSLPENVKVLSLGKEIEASKLKYIFNFYKYIWQERKNYDVVFVHMNQIHVILGGFFWRTLNKKIGFWYAHGHIPFNLRMAEKLADIIFTSTQSGFRLKSKKINVVGQGIDTEYFKPLENKPKNEIFLIITIGRISLVKDYETLINAAELLKKQNLTFRVNIIGGATTGEQKEYLQNMKNLIKSKNLENEVFLIGSIPNKDILNYLQNADLFVSMSHTGSLDKAILEAMACGIPMLTCNEAAKESLGEHAYDLMYRKKDFAELAEKIKQIANSDIKDMEVLSKELRQSVEENHSIKLFIPKILELYEI